MTLMAAQLGLQLNIAKHNHSRSELWHVFSVKGPATKGHLFNGNQVLSKLNHPA